MLHILTLATVLLTFNSFAQTPVVSEPIGSYNKGSLLNASDLPPEGPGYMRLFTKRNRGWGTEEIVSMIVETAADINQLYPDKDRLQAGDIGAEKGGQISRHGSHQNGLDIDITYYRVNGKEQKPESINGFQESMVRNGKLSSNFDIVRNWELVKTLHKHGKVQRIFLDTVIKRELCKHARGIGEFTDQVEVLRSLRPFKNHSDHLHVRLYCPPEAKACKAQEEVAPGPGC